MLNTEEPIQTKQHPVPFAMEEQVEEGVRDILQNDIIEKSTSQYFSPFVAFKTPEGTIRLCIDYRQVNKWLVDDCEPIPCTVVVFGHACQKRYYSKLDFTKGYWQIPIENRSQHITSFST